MMMELEGVRKEESISAWNRILNIETTAYMLNTASKEFDGEEGDTEEAINEFFTLLKENIDYRIVVVLATQWNTLYTVQQVKRACAIAGEYNASRFMMLMDYLAYRFAKGTLK